MLRAALLSLLALLLACCPPARAQQAIAVVAVGNASAVQTISREDITAIYLGNLSRQPGQQTLVPLDLEDGEIRDAFYQQVLGRSRAQMRAYWSRMVFTGKGQPPRAVSPDGMLNELRQNGVTIGYLPANRVETGVRVLLTVMVGG